jgi:primosomal protein N' (replication factor Y)
MQCHLCGHKQQAFFECPVCSDKDLSFKGVGTQRIQNELLELFPELPILRMDQDTTRGRNKHDSILQAFGKGKAPVLLGTQMIAKGLDFPNVTLVGVINADVGLAIPDFHSPERIFQLLTQVAGRAGRSVKSGEVIVQTYLPDHYAIQYARNHDYVGFYMEEISHRTNYNYPPITRMIQILFSSPQSSNVIKYSRLFASRLRKYNFDFCQIIGPSPALVSKMQNNYRWQVSIKINKLSDQHLVRIKEIIRNLISQPQIMYPKNLNVSVDVDPVSLF